ncbi:hypothetical protein [Actinacidiphila paucisporea]|uniref:Uncharacterized protein n=1 Tax=Actinacidiphila paucisporea TaxID=310782 RepID=A0A1M7N3Y2_9ACTN|nr:hypothetical protein [Actinacidiphila paucisporea]SHM98271.1 hypothetical protein SAMN05216499_117128 [Actinacidiphila paucisporea]
MGAVGDAVSGASVILTVLRDGDAVASVMSDAVTLKDLDLASTASTPSPLLRAVRDRLAATVAAGHAQDDLAAVDHQRKPPPAAEPGPGE